MIVAKLPISQTDLAKIVTENIGRFSREQRDCRGQQDCRPWQGCRNRRECALKLLCFSILSRFPLLLRLSTLLRLSILPKFQRQIVEIPRRLPPKNAEMAGVAESHEIADFADWGRRDCERSCQQILPNAPISPTLAKVPRSPGVSTEIAAVTDIAGREWEITCWDWKNWQDCWPGLPALQMLLEKSAEIDWLLRVPRLPILNSEIAETATEILCWDWRDCRDCRPGKERLPAITRLPSLPILQTKVAEIATVNASRNYNVPRSPTLAKVPRSPRVSTEIAAVTDIAGREWEIACRDWENWRYCRPGLLGLQRLPPKIAETAGVAESAVIAEIAVPYCRGCDGECWPRLPSSLGLLRVPRLPILQTKVAQSVDRDCRDYRHCRPRMRDCMSKLKNLTRSPAGIPGTAEVATKNAEIGGAAESYEIAEFTDRECQDCDGECRPT